MKYVLNAEPMTNVWVIAVNRDSSKDDVIVVLESTTTAHEPSFIENDDKWKANYYLGYDANIPLHITKIVDIPVDAFIITEKFDDEFNRVCRTGKYLDSERLGYYTYPDNNTFFECLDKDGIVCRSVKRRVTNEELLSMLLDEEVRRIRPERECNSCRIPFA